MTQEVCSGTREEWRDWLSKNYNKEKKVILVSFKKHTGKPSISHREAMEDAICFGWIDTTVKRIDEERFGRTFVRRTENGRWSKNTISYGKQMIEQGKMHPHGLKMYKEGLKKPTIDHGIGKNPRAPKELKELLDKDEEAKKNFKNMAPSYKRYYIIMVERAKLQETRERRAKMMFERIKQNKKPSD